MKNKVRASLMIITNCILMLAIVFGISGDNYWIEGWIFYLLFIVMIGIIAIPIYKDKALMKERMKSPIQKEQQKADKIIMLFFLPQLYGWLGVLPLEHRLGWTEKFPIDSLITGIAGFILATFVLYLTIEKNRHLYLVVKNKKDQKLVSDGIYGIVRHPMYMGIILMLFSGAFITSSRMGICLALSSSITLYIRTVFEERFLEKNLKGYQEYQKKTRKRLIPFII